MDHGEARYGWRRQGGEKPRGGWRGEEGWRGERSGGLARVEKGCRSPVEVSTWVGRKIAARRSPGPCAPPAPRRGERVGSRGPASAGRRESKKGTAGAAFDEGLPLEETNRQNKA